MKYILLIHQSADLYGSDKHILHLIDNVNKDKFQFIVVLPYKGQLYTEIQKRKIEVHVIPLLRLSRATVKPKNLFRLPIETVASIKAITRAVNNRDIYLVHSNTLSVLPGAIWSFNKKIHHIWNVHEMIVNPQWAKITFPLLLKFFSDGIICNSKATCDLLISKVPSLSKKSFVVLNGLDRKYSVKRKLVKNFREQLNVCGGDILISLVGRINRWKGQLLLLNAAEKLYNNGLHNLHYLFVGSPPVGQDHFLETLKDKINQLPFKNKIHILGFQNDIWKIWDATDIAVVPSIEPEPFGFVALEAMLSEKPVIAAAHGGLKEIVVHQETGLLFRPNDADSLAKSISYLSQDPFRRREYAKSGKKRAEEYFSLRKYISKYESIYDMVYNS